MFPLLKGVSRLVFDAESVLAVFVHIVSESEIYYIYITHRDFLCATSPSFVREPTRCTGLWPLLCTSNLLEP